MEKVKKYKNRLGVMGWFVKGRWGFERYLYSLHRITGLGILLYFLIHIFVTYARAGGASSWNSAMKILENPVFKFGEYLVYVAFVFHALNGIRLILSELGKLVGKPIEPVYPYKTSLDKGRFFTVLIMIIAAIFIVVGGYDFFILPH